MKGKETYLWFLTTNAFPTPLSPQRPPYGRGLANSFFCVYLSYVDVELLFDIRRADCQKISGVDPSQCLISSLKNHLQNYLNSRTACTKLAVTFKVEK